MKKLLGDAYYSIMGPPHGEAWCRTTRAMALAWVTLLALDLALLLLGSRLALVSAFPLVFMAPFLAGLWRHRLAATLLTSAGATCIGALCLHDPPTHQPPLWLLGLCLLAGGIANLLAWLEEREWSGGELLAGVAGGLPGLALWVLGLKVYSGMGTDTEWGQGSLAGSVTLQVAAAGAVVAFLGVFAGMHVFRSARGARPRDRRQ